MLPLILAGIQTGVGMMSKIKQGQEQKRFDSWLGDQQSKLNSWYQKESNTDYLDTAEGQSQYQGLRRMLKENTDRTADSAVKTGATAENVLAKRDQTGRVISDASAQMAALGTRRKDAVRNQYMAENMSLRGMIGANKQGAIAGASNTASNTFQGVGDLMGSSDFLSKILNRGQEQPS